MSDVRAILTEHGVSGVIDIRRTATEADATYLVATTTDRFVVKAAGPGSRSLLMQAALLQRAAERSPQVPSPRLLPGRSSGSPVSRHQTGTAIVTTFCPGVPLEEAELTPALVDDIAAAQSVLLDALADGDAAELFVPERNDWSLDAVVACGALVDEHAEPRHRWLLAELIAGYSRSVEPRLPQLPSQVIHADFNLSNVLVTGETVTGVIDFGDAVRAPRVFDVAVTACYLALARGGIADPLVQRYLSQMIARCALSEAEQSVIEPLVLARLAMVALLSRSIAARDPFRARYALRYDGLAVRLLDSLAPDLQRTESTA